MAETSTLERVLTRFTREGELYERLPDGKVRCFACGHRCLIPEGQRGICKVRYNEDGRLLVPTGYVAALQLDPVEKKPFFHAYPGSRALSFGMLGCDYHCGYCFVGDTLIATSQGAVPIERLFDKGVRTVETHDAEIAFLEGWEAVTATGVLRPIPKVFRHEYEGWLAVIEPFGFPAIRCTPDHLIFAVTGPDESPRPVQAQELTPAHLLVVPKSPSGALSHFEETTWLFRGHRAGDSGVFEADSSYFVPIRNNRREWFSGHVYNLEIEEEHSYLANCCAVKNCQNYITSQALRDPVAGVPPQAVTPKEIVNLALHNRARILTSTYNEPLITSEWAVEVFKEGRRHDLVCSYVSNGNATPEVLEYIRPWVDLYKVDLKGFNDKHYRKLGGLLKTVLDSIKLIHQKGFWLEIVTLVVPGFNDSEDEVREIAKFLVSVSPDIPWHVTAFHQDYKMTDHENTTAKALIRTAEIGLSEGLRYVYAGNLPGRVDRFENTYCPTCRTLLIERYGFTILKDSLTPTRGACPNCSATIPGAWG